MTSEEKHDICEYDFRNGKRRFQGGWLARLMAGCLNEKGAGGDTQMSNAAMMNEYEG